MKRKQYQTKNPSHTGESPPSPTPIFTSFEAFAAVDPITKGWLGDKKYAVTMHDGTKYLLRITPIDRYESRKVLFEMQKRIAALGVPICAPVEFGTCDDGVYLIQSWINGEDFEVALP